MHPLTWECARCEQRYLMDQPARMCERCDRIVCSTCFDAAVERCNRECADAFWLCEDEVLAMVHATPGVTLDQIVTRARTEALEDDPQRAPSPSWWVIRARDLVRDLLRSGMLRCAYTPCTMGARATDHPGPLCEFVLGAKGHEFYQPAVSA